MSKSATHRMLEMSAEIDEKATAGKWTADRVDHQDCMSYEIGPRWDGSHGFRFVIYDHHYEDKNERLNVAKFKADSRLIVHARNNLKQKDEQIRGLYDELTECRKELIKVKDKLWEANETLSDVKMDLKRGDTYLIQHAIAEIEECQLKTEYTDDFILGMNALESCDAIAQEILKS